MRVVFDSSWIVALSRAGCLRCRPSNGRGTRVSLKSFSSKSLRDAIVLINLMTSGLPSQGRFLHTLNAPNPGTGAIGGMHAAGQTPTGLWPCCFLLRPCGLRSEPEPTNFTGTRYSCKTPRVTINASQPSLSHRPNRSHLKPGLQLSWAITVEMGQLRFTGVHSYPSPTLEDPAFPLGPVENKSRRRLLTSVWPYACQNRMPRVCCQGDEVGVGVRVNEIRDWQMGQVIKPFVVYDFIKP